jgi:F0F1-type ATP synthase epsilon subunit
VEQNVAFDFVGADEDVVGSRVTLLIGVAELADEIDAERARVALEAAEARVVELGGSGKALAEGEEADPELVDAEAAILRAQVRLEAVEATTTNAITTT